MRYLPIWFVCGMLGAALPAAERNATGARARACYLAQFDREQAFRQLERWMAELRKPG